MAENSELHYYDKTRVKDRHLESQILCTYHNQTYS
jgi:hypothetical protein